MPAAGDNVFFGPYSGFGTTTATKTITLDANGYCNNMTWEADVANSPRFVSGGSFTVEVSGHLVLSPTTTYSVNFVFAGTTPATLTTNGPVLGGIGVEINKPGSSLTVADSLVTSNNAINVVRLTQGTFDVSGKKWTGREFFSSNDNVRTLNIANSDVAIYYFYAYQGQNKTLSAAGSSLYVGTIMGMDGGTYDKVSYAGGGNNQQVNIQSTVFSSLTFTWTSTGSAAWLGNNNTVLDSLRFMGQGWVGTNNTIGRLYFDANGTLNANNTVRYIKNARNFTVGGNGLNNVDSLLLAPSSTNDFKGTFNLNKYLYLAGQTCDAYTEVNGDSTNGVINFASGAIVDISNVILTGVKATGPVTPIPVSGIDGGGNAGFTINQPPASNTTLYWVGGPGNWNDRTHWSTSSGGAGGACVPFIGDDVVFDGNSGLASGTVTITSSSFCRNMTWMNVGNVTFSHPASIKFSIYGSLVMDNSVTMNSNLQFVGTNPASITTNGSTAGNLTFTINKTGGAVVTLADDWNNPTNGDFSLLSGGLNLSGRTVNADAFSSSLGGSRALDISNATLNFTTEWDYRGAGKSMLSTGSHITAKERFLSDGLNYPWVDATYSGTGSPFSIRNTTFGQLTFTAPGATVNVYIDFGNTIRRLEYKGRGIIGNGNTIDSLILAGSRNYFFGGTNNITRYLKAQSAPCAGLAEFRNYSPAGSTGTLNFSSGAVIEIANVYMQNMRATGPMTPIAFSGADAGGNSGWTITSATGGTRYWVGGSGDWNDASHWSTTSGGPGGACIPTVTDDVFFNSQSFSSGNSTVTINSGNAYCRNMDWTGAAFSPTFTKSTSFNLELWGNLVMNPAVTMNTPYIVNGGPAVMFMGPANSTLTSNGAGLGDFDFAVSKPNGSGLTLTDNYNNTNTGMDLRSGGLDLSNRTVTVSYVSDFNSGASPTSLNITNATINGSWDYRGAGKSLQAANSQITTPYFKTNGGTYNKVNVTTTAETDITIGTTTIDSLVFSNPDPNSLANIGAGNTINLLEFKGGGAIRGTGNTIDTLVFFPGNRYVLNSGTNTTITGEWYGSGTPCRLTEIVSSSTTNATITKTSGDVSFDYVRLQRVTGTGGAAYSTQSHSIDQGGNTGWTMAPYNGATPIYGLGPDTAVAPADFPITLRTDGFFGAPSSQYTWNDNSTADTLLVTGPGTYSVQVNFVDGCNISDAIVVSQAATLPVTLGRFTARLQDQCSGVELQWSTSSEQNSKDFTIQRSSDGRGWTTIGTIAAAGNSNATQQYSYTDGGVNGGHTYYYRLQLNDIDGRQKMSKAIPVRLDCGTGTYFVYPNPVRDMLTIQAPAGGGQKILAVYTAIGQRVLQTTIQPGAVKTIDTNDWKQGVYYVTIRENGKMVLTQKVMKQ